MKDLVFAAPVVDALIRRQIYVEQAKSWLHEQFALVFERVAAAITFELTSTKAERLSDLPRRRVEAIIKNVLSSYDEAVEEHELIVFAWIAAAIEDEGRYVGDTLRESSEGPFVQPAIGWHNVKDAIVVATGLTVAETLRTAFSDVRLQLRRSIQRVYAARTPVVTSINDIIGTRTANFRNGQLSRISRMARSLIDTAIQAGMQIARSRTFERAVAFAVGGYTWVSILDGRTSEICRSLSGRQFEFGKGPLPPMHYNCRSHIVPGFRDTRFFRDGVSRAVDAGESYYSWLARQTRDFQDGVLGPTRATLFRRGGLTADEFAAMNLNRSFRPITLNELRRTRPEVFARSGV